MARLRAVAHGAAGLMATPTRPRGSRTRTAATAGDVPDGRSHVDASLEAPYDDWPANGHARCSVHDERHLARVGFEL